VIDVFFLSSSLDWETMGRREGLFRFRDNGNEIVLEREVNRIVCYLPQL